MHNVSGLDLGGVSQANLDFVIKLKDSYGLLPLSDFLLAIKNFSFGEFNKDYLSLLYEIKSSVAGIGLKTVSNFATSINDAIKAKDYIAARDIVERKIGFGNTGVPRVLVPKIMELNNIYLSSRFLNTMPGTNGKPINLFKLPDYQ